MGTLKGSILGEELLYCGSNADNESSSGGGSDSSDLSTTGALALPLEDVVEAGHDPCW